MSELSALLKIRLEPELKAELERVAAELGVKPAALVREAIRRHLNTHSNV